MGQSDPNTQTSLDGRILIDWENGQLLFYPTASGSGAPNVMAGNFIAPGGVPSPGIGTGGFRVAPIGVDVRTATPSQLLMNSDDDLFKIVATDIVTVSGVTIDTAVGGTASATVEVPYDTDLGKPLVVASLIQGATTSDVRFTGFYTPAIDSFTADNDATIGTISWVGFTPSTGYFLEEITITSPVTPGDAITLTSVKLVKNDHTLGTNDNQDGVVITSTPTRLTYGSPTDLWGDAWTPSGSPNCIGFAVSFTDNINGNVTKYLKIEWGGPVPPSSASTIVGIEISFEISNDGTNLNFFSPTMKIYYSDPYPAVLTQLQWEGKHPAVIDFSDPTGLKFGGLVETSMNVDDGVLTFTNKATYSALGVGEVTNGPYQVRYYILQETAAE